MPKKKKFQPMRGTTAAALLRAAVKCRSAGDLLGEEQLLRKCLERAERSRPTQSKEGRFVTPLLGQRVAIGWRIR